MKRIFCVWDAEATKDANKRCGNMHGLCSSVLLFVGECLGRKENYPKLNFWPSSQFSV